MATYSRAQRISALVAAREWLGYYDGDEGPLRDGNVAGIPEDMVLAYELLGSELQALLEADTLASIRSEVRRANPGATASVVARQARAVLAAHPDLVPLVGAPQ